MSIDQTELLSQSTAAIKQLLSGAKLLLATATLVMVCAFYNLYSSTHHINTGSLCTSVHLSASSHNVSSSGTITEQHIAEPKTRATRAPLPRTPACSEAVAGLSFVIDGQQVQTTHILNALQTPLPGNKLHSIQVKGACRGFGGESNPATIFLRSASSDIPVFMAVWIGHEFAFLDQLFAKQGIVPRRIMDLGMNCGMASLYFTTHFPQAQIIAVEPGMESFVVASLNLVHQPRVFRELGAAVGQGGGYDKLVDRNIGAWAMGVDPVSYSDMTWNGTFGAMEVSYLMQKYGWDSIDYLKVDIEGSEKGICEAISANKADWIKSVRCVTFEYHDRYVPGVTAACDPAMRTAGFQHQGFFGELTVWCKS